MIDDVKLALRRASPTLWRDLLGIAAIGVALVVALHLPAALGAV